MDVRRRDDALTAPACALRVPHPQVMPFIQANISKNTRPEDWRCREAATLAFGLILDGPDPSCFKDTIKQALAYLLQAMKVRACMRASAAATWRLPPPAPERTPR